MALSTTCFEKYFLRKIGKGTSDAFNEKFAMKILEIDKIEAITEV